MKTNKKLLTIVFITISFLQKAQNGMDYKFFPFASYSRLRSGFPLATQNQNDEKALGVYQSNYTPNSFLEVNSTPLYMPFPMPGVALGEVFRTTSPNTLNSTWRMFTGTGTTAEKFNINIPANSNNTELNTVQNAQMLFSTNGFTRLMIDGGAGTFNAGNGGGRIAIGNNLPAGFAPQSRVHIHQQGDSSTNNTYIQFTNNATSAAANRGFVMTLNENNSTTLSNNEQNLSLAAPKGQIIFTDATTTITLEELKELKNLSAQVQQLQAEVTLLKKQQAQITSQVKN